MLQRKVGLDASPFQEPFVLLQMFSMKIFYIKKNLKIQNTAFSSKYIMNIFALYYCFIFKSNALHH